MSHQLQLAGYQGIVGVSGLELCLTNCSWLDTEGIVGVSGLELCLTNCSWLDTKVLWACLGWNCVLWGLRNMPKIWVYYIMTIGLISLRPSM